MIKRVVVGGLMVSSLVLGGTARAQQEPGACDIQLNSLQKTLGSLQQTIADTYKGLRSDQIIPSIEGEVTASTDQLAAIAQRARIEHTLYQRLQGDYQRETSNVAVLFERNRQLAQEQLRLQQEIAAQKAQPPSAPPAN